MTRNSAGARLRQAVADNDPLQVVGTVTAYAAIMAEQVGHQALYLSGGGVSASSLGVPDLGIATRSDVLEDARRITAVTSAPLLVDADTGFGGPLSVARTTREVCRAGAAGLHIEDQVEQKRCGHRPNKVIVGLEEMVERVEAAVDARPDPEFVIMARTDALGVEGMDAAIERTQACVEAGADMVFPEAMQTLEQYERFATAVDVPVLANLTEFGRTPLFTTAELAAAGVKLVLYPLSAFRAMSKAALEVYRRILADGTQQGVIDAMQTREECYELLDYHTHERRLDELLQKKR